RNDRLAIVRRRTPRGVLRRDAGGQNSAYRRTGTLSPIGRPTGGWAFFLLSSHFTMATYLVTGGAGFIGSHLVEELVRRGDRLRVVDNLSTGKRQNIAHLSAVEFVEGELADLGGGRRPVD